MRSLDRLFSPVRIGTLELKNRIVMAPITTNWAPADGTVSQQQIDFWEARAEGGAALIIFESVTVDESFPYIMQSVGLWDDSLIPAFRKFVDAMHAHGAAVAPQITHPGPESFSWIKGVQPVGPSPVVCKVSGQVCRELRAEEIPPIAVQYGEAARRARQAGCDAVEVHAAHAYMLAGAFLSPLRNRRTDEFGGDVEGRLKFLLMVLESVRERAGRDFPVILRISGDEHHVGGRDLRDTLYIAPRLVHAGVDCFHVSGGVVPEQFWRVLPPTGTAFGINVPAAAALKQAVDVPVMVVGRITEPLLAEEILKKGQADLVALGRALLADPEWPQKASEGRFEDIAPCTGCGLGCLRTQMTAEPMTCVINPAVGREKETRLSAAPKRKKVLVVGGGPAGMEAARVAAIRGHDVTLCEKEERLGGQFVLAPLAPGKHELGKWIRYLSVQVEKAGVKVELSTEATAESIREARPDVVVVATGARPRIPDLPGALGSRVFTANDVLAGRVAITRGNVLVLGGGMVGCETADLLADPGYNQTFGRVAVTIVETVEDIGLDVLPQRRVLLLPRLAEKQVRCITSAQVVEILPDGVVMEREGRKETVREMDFIILACGAEPVDELSDRLQAFVPELHVIGDALKPRKMLEAVAEGFETGRRI